MKKDLFSPSKAGKLLLLNKFRITKIMKIKQLIIKSLFYSLFISTLSITVFAQKNSGSQPTTGKKAVIFKTPKNYMSAPFQNDKKGLMFLNAGKPSGIFVVYTPDNLRSEDFVTELKTMFAGMFIHNEKGDRQTNDLKWSESVLPTHKNAEKETAKLFTTSNDKNEVQVLTYIRTISEGQDIIYGYFAMKDKEKKSNSADFADSKGDGIKAFDEFWKTITVPVK